MAAGKYCVASEQGPNDGRSPKSLTGLTAFRDGKTGSLQVKNVLTEHFNNPEDSTRGGTATVSNLFLCSSLQDRR
jgi:hypothetical protein